MLTWSDVVRSDFNGLQIQGVPKLGKGVRSYQTCESEKRISSEIVTEEVRGPKGRATYFWGGANIQRCSETLRVNFVH